MDTEAIFFFVCRFGCLHIGLYMLLQVPEEAREIGFPGLVLIDNCEASDMSAGNQIQILWENSRCS